MEKTITVIQIAEVDTQGKTYLFQGHDKNGSQGKV